MRSKKFKKIVVTAMLSFLILFLVSFIAADQQSGYARNLTQRIKDLSIRYGLNSGEDVNGDGVVNILDVTTVAVGMGDIEINYILNSYVDVIKPQDKQDYLDSGFTFLSDKCFPVSSEGINLFDYVNAAEGMILEIIEGDQTFRVENDRLYFDGQAPAMAKVRLRNALAESKEFFVYGTNDRELHDFTYDYLLYLANNNNQ
jgi:hypothetical protein